MHGQAHLELPGGRRSRPIVNPTTRPSRPTSTVIQTGRTPRDNTALQGSAPINVEAGCSRLFALILTNVVKASASSRMAVLATSL